MEKRMWRAAVVTLSDKGFAGEREDKSGDLLCRMLCEAGYEVVERILLPDEQREIEKCLCTLSDEKEIDLIATTGGTGFSPRDCTPEATLAVATRNAPGDRGGYAPRFPEGNSKSHAQQRRVRDPRTDADH